MIQVPACLHPNYRDAKRILQRLRLDQERRGKNCYKHRDPVSVFLGSSLDRDIDMLVRMENECVQEVKARKEGELLDKSILEAEREDWEDLEKMELDDRSKYYVNRV